jgi:hypothetical protein
VRLAALHQVDRHAHRRILLVAQRLRRGLVHRDDLAGGVDAHARVRSGKVAFDCVALADQDHLDVGRPRLKLERGRNRHMGAVVAAHAIDRNRDQRGYSSCVLTTFLPR